MDPEADVALALRASDGASHQHRSHVLAGLRGAMERELDGIADASRSFAEVSLALARVEQIARVARDVVAAMEGRPAPQRRPRQIGGPSAGGVEMALGAGSVDAEMVDNVGGFGPDRGETLAARAIREVVAMLPRLAEVSAERNRPPPEALISELIVAVKVAREAGSNEVADQAEGLAAARLRELAAADRRIPALAAIAAPDNGAPQAEQQLASEDA